MSDSDIGRGKVGRRAYRLDDVMIVPSRRTRDHADVDPHPRPVSLVPIIQRDCLLQQLAAWGMAGDAAEGGAGRIGMK